MGSEEYFVAAWNKGADNPAAPWVVSETLDAGIVSSGSRLDLTFGRKGAPSYWALLRMTA